MKNSMGPLQLGVGVNDELSTVPKLQRNSLSLFSDLDTGLELRGSKQVQLVTRVCWTYHADRCREFLLHVGWCDLTAQQGCIAVETHCAIEVFSSRHSESARGFTVSN